MTDKPKSETEHWKKEAQMMTLDGHNLLGATKEYARRLIKAVELYDAAQDRIKELEKALAFTLRGLEMYKTYRSPGNIAEIETTIRAALNNGGGE